MLLIICFASFFFTVYKQNEVPVCTNADEAAFGYNAYSLLTTGKDEYGTEMPLRLKSFGDNKLPLYSYLSVPFIALFGLDQMGIKGLNILGSVLLPLLIYFLTKELFGRKSYGLVAALLTATSLSTHITARQAHESLLSLNLSLSMFLFYLRSKRTHRWQDRVMFLLSTGFSLFSYHPARLLVFFQGLLIGVDFFRMSKTTRKTFGLLAGMFAAIVILFLASDLVYNPSRVSNLLFVNSPGFALRINELRGEGANRLFYNKLTLGAVDLTYQNLAYFSPQFLLARGDENYRFGFPGMSLITLVEYALIFIGLYYLFRNKHPQRFALVAALLISPLTGSLSWAGISLTRVMFEFALIFIVASYGFIELLRDVPARWKVTTVAALVTLQLVGLFISWNFYLNHYPKRAIVIRSQECGYKELATYIKQNYDRFDHFYITKEHGQPYMHLLYQLRFPPDKYQSQSKLSSPDKYGFGQVEKFDKFIFHVPNELNEKKVVYIGYPWEIRSRPGFNKDSDEAKIKTIRIGSEEIFSILER